VEVKIVWVSGHYSMVYAQPPIWREEDVTGYNDMIKKVQSLWQEGFDDNGIAAQLTQDGHRSGIVFSTGFDGILTLDDEFVT